MFSSSDTNTVALRYRHVTLHAIETGSESWEKTMRQRFHTVCRAALLLGSVSCAGRVGAIERGDPMIEPTLAGDKFPDLTKPHPFSVYDMVSMERLGEPTPSPDGTWIVFTRRTWDPEANKTTISLWFVSVDGKNLRQLTSAKHVADNGPVWSPDGRTIAFVSNRGGSQQIWTIRLDGGEARQLTKFPVDVGNIQWSLTGTHLSFSADVYPDANMEESAKRDKEKGDNPVKAMKFERLMIRHWDTWSDGKRSHIFVVPVKQSASSTLGSAGSAAQAAGTSSRTESSGDWSLDGEPIDLMKGVEGDCPIKPFGGVDDYAWSPDGKEIAYTTQ